MSNGKQAYSHALQKLRISQPEKYVHHSKVNIWN